MRQMIFIANQNPILADNCLVQTNATVETEINLDAFPKDEAELLITHRRTLSLARDAKGKPTGIRRGRQTIPLPPSKG